MDKFIVLAGHADTDPELSFWVGLGAIAVVAFAAYALYRRVRK